MVYGSNYFSYQILNKYLYFSIQGNQGDQWINAKIDIPVTPEYYDFIFEGVVV